MHPGGRNRNNSKGSIRLGPFSSSRGQILCLGGSRLMRGQALGSPRGLWHLSCVPIFTVGGGFQGAPEPASDRPVVKPRPPQPPSSPLGRLLVWPVTLELRLFVPRLPRDPADCH